MDYRSLFFFTAWILTFLFTTWLIAQAPPKPLVPQPKTKIFESGSIKPDAVHLRNADGEAIFVPMIPWESFKDYLREKSGELLPRSPTERLSRLQGKGVVGQGYVDIDWTAEAEVLSSNSVLRIKMGMENQNLVDWTQSEPGSLLRLANEGGLEWFLDTREPLNLLEVKEDRDPAKEEPSPENASSEERQSSPQPKSKVHRISFRTRLKLQQNGSLNILKLDLEDVPTTVLLSIPGNRFDVQAIGSGIPVVETKEEEGTTIASIVGVGGNLTISWKNADETTVLDSIEVDSLTKWEVGAAGRTWNGSSRFVIRSFGKKRAKEATIQLPKGMRWLVQSSPRLDDGLALEPIIPPGGSEAPSDLPEQLRLRIFDSVQEGSIEFTLNWEWSNIPDADGQFSLVGPRITDVQRHEGRVEIESPSGFHLGWRPSPAIQFEKQDRISETNAIRYAFRFNDQNYQLNGLLSKDENRIRVRPRYVVSIDDERATLVGVLEFAVDPISLSDFRLHLGDWILDRLEIDGRGIDYEIVEDGAVQPQLQELIPPNSASGNGAAIPMRGIRLSAFLPWKPSSKTPLAIAVPKISELQPNRLERVYSHGTGGIAIFHRSSLRQEPESLLLDGLIAEPRLPPSIEEFITPSMRDVAKYYRFQAEGQTPNWRSVLTKLSQRVSVRRQFEIEMDETRIRTSQLFKLRIENDPLNRLRLIVPKFLVESESVETDFLKVLIDGEPVEWTLVPDTSIASSLPANLAPDTWSVVELLGDALEGSIDLQIDSVASMPKLSSSRETAHAISFVWPIFPNESEQLLEGTNTIKIEGALRCEIPEDFLVDAREFERNIRRLVIPKGTYSIPLQAQKMDSMDFPSIEIQRAWLQTTLSQHRRRNRFTVQFRSRSDSLAFQFLGPKGAPSEIELLLNGIATSPKKIGDLYIVDLPEQEEPDRLQSLEVWTWMKRDPSLMSTITPEVPSIKDSKKDLPFLWQIVVPHWETLIASTGDLVPEYRWSWQALGFGRRGPWRQETLEAWVSASQQEDLGVQASSYVLSSIGVADPMWIVVAPKYLLWLPVGTIFLCGFSLWYNVPIVRNPFVLAILGVAFSIAVPFATDLVILLAQMLVLSFLLLIVFALVRWTFDYRMQRRSIFAYRPSVWLTSSSGIEASKGNPPTVPPTSDAVTTTSPAEIR